MLEGRGRMEEWAEQRREGYLGRSYRAAVPYKHLSI